MLRITQSNSAAGAKTYFSTADYYSEGQELVGLWRGEGATRLGLSGVIRQEQWDALCDNLDPRSGEPLTVRTRDARRVGYDFTFSVPKSVSLFYGMTRDVRIIDAFRDAVHATMQDIEAEMQTRVRSKDRDEDRVTGNLVWGEYVHTTGRPVDGVPDPQLHSHCFAFNCTWDEHEQRWKAGQFAGVKRDGPYFEALFLSRFAKLLTEAGLPIERRERDWELAGFSAKMLRQFSRRTELIERMAHELGITDPDMKAELGATTREKKLPHLQIDKLQQLWRSRLTADDEKVIAALAAWDAVPPSLDERMEAAAAVTYAVGHCFERSSVVPERRVIAEAIRHSAGLASPDAILAAMNQTDLLRADRDGVRMVSTHEVLAEEERMIGFARSGRGTCRPFVGSEYRFHGAGLSSEQALAAQHVLESTDRVIVVRGKAGTGKTTMFKEVVRAIEGQGQRVVALAPSAEASRGTLREKGFTDADTLARFLVDETMQERARGATLWLDEAGLVGTQTMVRFFELADRLDARIILSGDRFQHGSVERGAALRLLETEAGIRPAELREIRRQEARYKDAVHDLSEGRVEQAFQTLDELGWIREVQGPDRYRLMANEYADALATLPRGQRALVLSPTHREGERVAAAIRLTLRERGQLDKTDRQVPILEAADLTQAQRADASYYQPDAVLVFHQNAKGYRKGDRVTLDGDASRVPFEQADRFQVFYPSTMPVAAGDLLRITRNGKTADGKHELRTGAVHTVQRVTRGGDIVLANGWKVAKDFGFLAQGYVVTSHSAQGRSVHTVFIGQSADSRGASSAEQAYVSVSRGEKRAVIFTDDKQALLHAISECDERLAATDLWSLPRVRERAAALSRADASSREAAEHLPQHEVPA